MEPLTRQQLTDAFAGEDCSALQLPQVEAVDWAVLDYLGWIHSSGHLGFLVTEFDGDLHALVLRRARNESPRRRPQMCSWCRFVHPSGGAAMFMRDVDGSDGRRSRGMLVCRNLDCSLRIRNLTGDIPGYLPETIRLPTRVRRLGNNLRNYFGLVQPQLFI